MLAAAALLYLWALSRNGWANDYYAAAARSMSSSWHNFLFNSFDAAGVQTLDKPPLAFWVQALSVRLFGYGSMQILVPQALMGVGTVLLSYDLVFRRFGRWPAAFAGAGVLATPIVVAMSRHNNPDALLTLLSVAAIWTLMRALQDDGRARWVVATGVVIGLAFETKMGAGLLVLPAIVIAYFWASPGPMAKTIRNGLKGGAAMLVTGLAWPVLVWLTPASSRPWVSGTSDNSIWSLIVNYNGAGRLDGQAGGPGGAAAGGGGAMFGNEPGIFRLFGNSIGGQAGWLLIFAVFTIFALVLATRLRRDDPRTPWVLAVGGSLLTMAAAFSFAKGIFHPYYVVQLAPFAAMLFGAGLAILRRRGTEFRALAAAAIVLSGYATIQIASNEDAGLGLLPALVMAASIAAAAALFAPALARRQRAWVLAAFMGLLLVAPAAWAVQTPGHATGTTFPAGGPQTAMSGPRGGMPGGGMTGGNGGPPAMNGSPSSGTMPGGGAQLGSGTQGGSAQAGPGFGPPGAASQSQSGGTTQPPVPPAFGNGTSASGGVGSPGGGGMFGGGATTLEAARYAAANGGGTVAVAGQQAASTAIIENGYSVAGLGGFSGRESTVSVDWLADAVAAGKIRWVLTEGAQMVDQSGRAGSDDAISAAASACTAVTDSSAPSGLYDCQGKAAAIRAQES